MKSVTEVYLIGKGPSSSHTMGPEKAAKLFRAEHPDADRFEVRLYGSLALTGEGHGTDRVLRETLGEGKTDIRLVPDAPFRLEHPNTMDLFASKNGEQIGFLRVRSIGGGAIEIDGRPTPPGEDCYPQHTFAEITAYCEEKQITLPQYVAEFERTGWREYLRNVLGVMRDAVERGIHAEGVLPGELGVRRKAATLYRTVLPKESPEMTEMRLRSAYAYAVSEENAAGGVICTAPTCGACGVLPAVLLRAQAAEGYDDEAVLDALATAGLIGTLVRTNASISGAECGCQAEIGTACSMAAAGLAQLRGYDLRRIGSAAETAMEHSIGLTCDPVCGLVQIPCIERNSVAAQKAVHAALLAGLLADTQKVSFDCIVRNMYETGRDLLGAYRETSAGGLAKLYSIGSLS
ncbi:MAG TPA: serine dehydratase [Clostridiales bacterium]|nr:serine dehydratase [Clostridiales bacterium]